MQAVVLLALVGLVACQNGNVNSNGNSKTQGKYVWDLLKPALTSAEVLTILASKDAGAYPTYASIPQTNFACSSKAQPGFYADMDTQCQVFHRCEQSGNQTDYICVNGTIFNQITLVCDSWFNVECEKSIDYENYANSRLYTDQPLFDTPPADYVAPSSQVIANSGAVSTGTSNQQRPAPRQPVRVQASRNVQTTRARVNAQAGRGGQVNANAQGGRVSGSASASGAAGRSDSNIGTMSVNVDQAQNADQVNADNSDQQ